MHKTPSIHDFMCSSLESPVGVGIDYYPLFLQMEKVRSGTVTGARYMGIRNRDSGARQNWVQIQASPFIPMWSWVSY